MPAGGGLGMRTVWISLRAMNYSDQAFRDTIRNVDKLDKAQKAQLRTLLKAKDAAMKQIQVGMLYAAMTAMLTQRLWTMMSVTQQGSQFMAQFNQTISETKVAFADALFTALKPFLEVLMNFLNVVNKNKALMTFVAGLTLLGVGALAAVAAIKALKGITDLHNASVALNSFLVQHNMLILNAHNATIFGLTVTYRQLAVAISAAVGGFAIAYSLLSSIKGPIGIAIAAFTALAAAIIAAWVATTALSSGVKLAVDTAAIGVAAGAGAAILGNITGFATGTMRVPETGTYMLHEGERVYNPQTNRPTGAQSDFNSGPRNQTVNIDMSGMTLQTKMDKEELVPFLKRELRNITINKE